MLLDLFGKITNYPLTPTKRMTAHFYEHFLIPRTEENHSCEEYKYGFAGGFRPSYFQAPKVKPKSKEKIIELTIHLEACKSAFLTFQKAQKKVDFTPDCAFVCNASENHFFEMGSKIL